MTKTDKEIETIIKENSGSANAIYDAGVKLLTDDDPKCKVYFECAAKLGHDEAVFQLGQLYLHGLFAAKDYEMCHFLFSSLARKGHVESVFLLGIMYGKGDGIPKSEAFSKHWYWIAALAKHSNAIESLTNLEWLDANSEITDNSSEFHADYRDFKALGVFDWEVLVERLMWAKFRIGDIVHGDYKRPYGSVYMAPKDDLTDSYFYLAQNLDNLINKSMGVRFYDGEEIFFELNYGDLCMLKLRGGHLRDYPMGIKWIKQNDRPKGISTEELFGGCQIVSYESEVDDALFPFDMRSIIREMMVKAGISEPRYSLLETKHGTFITFNILEHCKKFEHTTQLIEHWGVGIQWILPRCYTLCFIDDDLASHPV